MTDEPAKRPVGRPSLYKPEIVTEICERLSRGEPLATMCRQQDHLPAWRTIYDWMDADPEISAAITRARDAGEQVIAADCLQIADTPQEGVETVTKPDGSVEERRGDMLGHRKLRIETRLKLLAKWNPKKWGDKLAVGGAEDLPPVQGEIKVVERRIVRANAGNRDG